MAETCANPLAARAAVDFVLSLRRGWANTLYPRLRKEFDERSATSASGEQPLVQSVHELPSYPWFAWLERGAQKMLWRAVSDSIGEADTRRTEEIAPASLKLDPSLALPAWYTDWDIHLQPGGVWSHDRSAAVYELGAQLVMLGENDDYRFHRLFCETALPQRDYARIIDLGCGFGKSTWPLKARFADAEVIGVDLAAPCLRLAAQRAGERGLAIDFLQADSCATGIAASSAQLVTSTMLVHELPVTVLPDLFAETARLLAPGGVLRFLDFQLTGDRFRDLAMLEHGARNNEPFMPPMLKADLVAMAHAAGLVDARWVAFDERSRGRLETLRWPVRAEWHFPWAVLEAEKPG
ncbi:MAG: class I SAM-dependent methyltransferase [Casimicrobiaceae bacterium]